MTEIEGLCPRAGLQAGDDVTALAWDESRFTSRSDLLKPRFGRWCRPEFNTEMRTRPLPFGPQPRCPLGIDYTRVRPPIKRNNVLSPVVAVLERGSLQDIVENLRTAEARDVLFRPPSGRKFLVSAENLH